MSLEAVFNVDTPIEKLFFDVFTEQGVQVFIKRDDLIHPFISGNKWRKLKYNFLEAERIGVRTIVTFGGAYSNHLIATAVACAKLGYKSIGLVRGEELTPASNFVLRLCVEHGMELRFVSRAQYKDESAIAKLLESDENYFVIPEGGDNEFGVMGCAEILPKDLEYDHVFVPVGTSTTMRGLLRSSGENTLIHGVAAMNQADYLKTKIETESVNGVLLTNHAYGGFGKYDSAQLIFNQQFASKTGILIDPVYTGKMMRCMFDLISQTYFPRGTNILCIHTGGLTGVLSNKWLTT